MKQQPNFAKQCLLATTILLAPCISQAQWATSGGNIFNTNAGSVGIGTATPLYKLHVDGPTYLNGTTYVTGTNVLYGNINWLGNLFVCNSGPKQVNLNGSTWGFVNGSVGIGTTAPGYTLDVNGTFRAVGNGYFTGGNVGIGTTTPSQKLEVAGNISLTAAAGRRIFMGGQAGGTFGLAYGSADPNYGIFYTEGSPDYVSISPNGNATNGSMNVYGDGKVNIATALTIGTTGGFCPNAALDISSSSAPAVYAYSSDASNGLGIYGVGKHIGMFGLGGYAPDCPGAYYGNFGVAGSALGDATNDATGVEAYGDGGPYAIGVRGTAFSGTAANYGVLGVAAAIPGSYAGYFNGNVNVTGVITNISDAKLKNNIRPLENELDKIMALKPSSYTFKTEEYKQMNMSDGEHYGLIAQELEEVFPNLVRGNVHPEMKDKNGKIISEKVTFKSVNYIELIPVLIAAVQEQQKTINNKNEELQTLKTEIAEIKSALSKMATYSNNTATAVMKTNTSWLEQSVPNPTGNSARIAYYVADDVTQATIVLSRTDGSEVKKYSITEKGSGSIVIDASGLKAGEYIYSLVTGKGIADAKRMIIVK